MKLWDFGKDKSCFIQVLYYGLLIPIILYILIGLLIGAVIYFTSGILIFYLIIDYCRKSSRDKY